MPKDLTPKQQKFIAEYIKNGQNGTQAALKTYGKPDKPTTYKTADIISRENLAKPRIKNAIDIALKKHNITLDRALLPVSKGLDATKYRQNKEGKIEEIDDIDTQLRASDRALKLLGVSGEQQGSFHLHLHAQRQKYKL